MSFAVGLFPFIKGFVYRSLGQAELGAAAQTDLSPSPQALFVGVCLHQSIRLIFEYSPNALHIKQAPQLKRITVLTPSDRRHLPFFTQSFLSAAALALKIYDWDEMCSAFEF